MPKPSGAAAHASPDSARTIVAARARARSAGRPTRHQRSIAAAHDAASTSPPSTTPACAFAQEQKQRRDPAPAIARDGRQQHRQQEQRQQMRPQHPDARRQHEADRHHRRARRQRPDHQAPGQDGGAHHQRRRRDLQAGHAGGANDRRTSTPATATRDPARARPRTCASNDRCAESGASARCPARRADARTCRSAPASAAPPPRTPRRACRRPGSRTGCHGQGREASWRWASTVYRRSGAGLSTQGRVKAPSCAAVPLLSTVGAVKWMTLSKHGAQANGLYCEACVPVPRRPPGARDNVPAAWPAWIVRG